MIGYEGLSKYEGVSNIVEDLEEKGVETAERNGLRITPAKLIYLDTYVGQIYVKRITFQNVSNHRIVLRILKPYSLAFKVTQEGKWIFLPPGMKKYTKVFFRCATNKAVKSSIPILINEVKHEIQIDVREGEANVKVYPDLLDFGVLDVGCPFVSKNVSLENGGVCPAMFSVEFAASHLQLVAYPRIGRIGAYKNKTIKIVMTCFEVGEYLVEMWVKTEPLQSVLIKAIFMKPSLSAMHPLTTGDFTLIEFEPTLEQSIRSETLIVRNLSSRTSSFTVMAEIGADVMTLNEARLSDINYKYFSIKPFEGKLGAFEGRIFTASFHPSIVYDEKGWKHRGDNNIKEFLGFVRVIRFEVVDTDKEAPENQKNGSQYTLTDDSLNVNAPFGGAPTHSRIVRPHTDQIILRFCLHGLAVKPSIEVLPDELSFDVDIGCVVNKVLSFKNITPLVDVGYRVIKKPFFYINPSLKVLKPMQRVEALIKFKALSLGSQNTVLKIEMITPKEVSDDNTHKKIGLVEVKVKIKVRSKTKRLKPQFNAGISPKEVLHEVGVNFDQVTFKGVLEGAKAPVLMPKPSKRNKRPWLTSNYSVAVPNDRGLSFAVKPYDKNMITPFTGKRRYIPPAHPDYAYSKDEAQAKKSHEEIYNLFMARLGRERRKAMLDYEGFVNDFNFALDRRLFDKAHMYDDVEDVTFDNVFKEVVKYSDLCPLSPFSLFNIKVNPKNLDFGLVPPNIDVTNYITVENKNKFPVAVKLIVQKLGIIIPIPSFIVGQNSRATKPVVINLNYIGKFFSNLNYVINTHHMFDLKVSAEVKRRTLEVSQTMVNFPKASPDEIFQRRCVPIKIFNPLSVPTSFYWKTPPLTAFKVVPSEGTINGLNSLSCTIYFVMNTKHISSTTISLVVVKGPTIAIQCNTPDDKVKLSVFNSKIYCPFISLGLPYEEKVLLFNPNFRDEIFMVTNTNPKEGVIIRPACGVVKARACYMLHIIFTMNQICPFDFEVSININAKAFYHFKVSGFVAFPKVNFSPDRIHFKLIPCSSYETTSVNIQNESNVEALVRFAMEDAHQMKISLSKFVRDPGLLSEGITLPPKTERKIYIHFMPKELGSFGFLLPAIINNILGPPNSREEKSVLVKNYIKSIVKCQGPKCEFLKTPESLSVVKIDCTTMNPMVSFNQLELNFVKKNNTKELQLLKVKNHQDATLKVWFDYEQLLKSPFYILKKNVIVKILKLQPFEEIVLHAYFSPKKPGTFTADFPVYISCRGVVTFYNVIRFTGIYHKSSIYCSEQMIYFLPLPLYVEEERSIYIIANHQHRKTKLSFSKFMVSGDYDSGCISCEFPKGVEIQPEIDNFTIPVTVKFRSTKAVSAIVLLQFKDGYDGVCNVGVCFTAENCKLTTYVHTFLSSMPPTTTDERDEDSDISEGSVISDEKDIPSSEVDTDYFVRRERVDEANNSIKRVSKLKTQPSQEEVSTSLGRVTSRKSLMDQISEALKRKAAINNRLKLSLATRSDEFEKTTPTSAQSDILIQEDDVLVEELEEIDLKGQHLKILLEVEQYPLFPADLSDTFYAEYMRREEEFVEQWLYEQGFQCSFRMRIGEDLFSTKTFQKCLVSRSKSYQTSVRSILDLVLRLIGKDFEMEFSVAAPLPEDDCERISYCLSVYNQIIVYLKSEGALMEHVFPFYLLCYDDYVIYYKKLRTNNVLLHSPEELDIKCNGVMYDKERYERLCHQCWLDLFLQLFKVIFQFPIHKLLMSNSSNMMEPRISATYSLEKSELESNREKGTAPNSMFWANMNVESTYYSQNECVLLNWMNHLFEFKRNKWNSLDKTLCVPPRTITNFTTDLRDGVVLTAVTTYFCPYLIQEFQHFYYKPASEAEYLHNAELLTSVWWNIRLGLVVTPLHFKTSDQITMIIIVTHLYNNLRTYVPRSSLKLSTSLSTSITRRLILSNPSDSKIRFSLHKIGDTNDCFMITKPQNTITIQPKQKVALALSYSAKRLFKVKCVLVFCGSCLAGNYANNLVFEVEAEPNKFDLQSHYVINVPIYRTVFINLELLSPYETTAVYDIWYTEYEPLPGKVIIYKWSKIKDVKIPRMLYVGCSSINVPGLHTKSTVLPIVVASFSLSVNCFWLIFSNERLGDFIVKLTLTPRYDYDHEVFNVKLPSEECIRVPTTMCSATCPRLVHINVLARNARFWEAIKTMLFFTLSDKEKKFWNTHLETTIGLKLIKWMISKIKDSGCKKMADIFDSKVTFKLKCDTDKVEVYNKLTINVHCPAFGQSSVHCQ
ncbi:cilia- and flagella-associated protein 47-like isoform X2 [Rhodnius prolixus]|uniref:cilia- and flagella-associated protein 47-like isoform X2 n=1 Tax=Rhodnius prolixus TaxID=13249 RepID=UPI003D187D95